MTTRRDFLVGSVVTLVFVPACGGGSTAPTDASMGASCTGTISANHGHVLTILGSDLTTPRDRTYNIQGSSDHTHSVMFTAAQMQMLAERLCELASELRKNRSLGRGVAIAAPLFR